MKRHLSNAVYGVIDYAAYPIGMLLVAPIVLHRLGAAEYGVWTVATAVTSTGGIIAAGFGDANIQQVAGLRAAGDEAGLKATVRCMVGINSILGGVFAIAGWLLSPLLSRHVVPLGVALQTECLIVLRLASVMILLRALESVCISTQRAFERYGAAVRVSIGCRMLALLAAGVLVATGYGIAAVLSAALVVTLLGTVVQFAELRRLLSGVSFAPAFHRDAIRALFGFGIFSWLQAVAGVVFGQGDRLLVGVSLGAVTVASYSICVQLAQPLFGITAAALHFLFPYLAGRLTTLTQAHLLQTLFKGFAANLLVVLCGAAVLLAAGPWLLAAWAGAAVAQSAAPILPLVVGGTALLGLSVTGTYALLALGLARTVCWIAIGSGVAMLLLMVWLLPVSGVHGLALARLAYGALALLVYPSLAVELQRRRRMGVRARTQEARLV